MPCPQVLHNCTEMIVPNCKSGPWPFLDLRDSVSVLIVNLPAKLQHKCRCLPNLLNCVQSKANANTIRKYRVATSAYRAIHNLYSQTGRTCNNARAEYTRWQRRSMRVSSSTLKCESISRKLLSPTLKRSPSTERITKVLQRSCDKSCAYGFNPPNYNP